MNILNIVKLKNNNFLLLGLRDYIEIGGFGNSSIKQLTKTKIFKEFLKKIITKLK